MMPVEVTSQDLIRLNYIDANETSMKKSGARLIAEKIVKSYRASTGLFMLSQQADGSCVFLDMKSRRCTVYENRPEMCRKFPTEMGIRLSFCPYTEKSRS
jgi:Fe-S-cluster containining protein